MIKPCDSTGKKKVISQRSQPHHHYTLDTVAESHSVPNRAHLQENYST